MDEDRHNVFIPVLSGKTWYRKSQEKKTWIPEFLGSLLAITNTFLDKILKCIHFVLTFEGIIQNIKW